MNNASSLDWWGWGTLAAFIVTQQIAPRCRFCGYFCHAQTLGYYTITYTLCRFSLLCDISAPPILETRSNRRSISPRLTSCTDFVCTAYNRNRKVGTGGTVYFVISKDTPCLRAIFGETQRGMKINRCESVRLCTCGLFV